MCQVLKCASGCRCSFVTSTIGGSKVGFRKRPRPVAREADKLSDGTGTIPVHMSLVRSTDSGEF